MTTYSRLKDKERALRAGFPPSLALRVHRSISWLGRAEKSVLDDPDARFIFLWVAFNAAYADEAGLSAFSRGERDAMSRFFRHLVTLDSDRRIHRALWEQFHGPVRDLMSSKYVYNPFWQHHNRAPGYEDWADRFRRSTRAFVGHFQRGETATVLSFVFDRLYVLRNQLVHGGATWNSRVNRRQIGDGAAILGFLVPVFVDLMMDNPAEEWGEPHYPVVD